MQRKDPFVVGEYYHVYNRGVDKRIIFNDSQDYRRFIILLYICNSSIPIKLDNLIGFHKMSYEQVLIHERGERLVSIGAWCLMPNHFHLLLKEEVSGGISKFMGKIGTGYSMYFNARNDRKGSLFSGRFKSKNISEDVYMKHLFGYIHLNPLDLGITGWEEMLKNNNDISSQAMSILDNYNYSSYKEYLNFNRVETPIINKEAFPEYFRTSKSFKDFLLNYLINP